MYYETKLITFSKRNLKKKNCTLIQMKFFLVSNGVWRQTVVIKYHSRFTENAQRHRHSVIVIICQFVIYRNYLIKKIYLISFPPSKIDKKFSKNWIICTYRCKIKYFGFKATFKEKQWIRIFWISAALLALNFLVLIIFRHFKVTSAIPKISLVAPWFVSDLNCSTINPGSNNLIATTHSSRFIYTRNLREISVERNEIYPL